MRNFSVRSYSEIEANEVSILERDENQVSRIDLFIKIVFTTMPKISSNLDANDNRDMDVAEGIYLRIEKNDILPSNILFEGNHITIPIICDDLICDDNGSCNDPEGLYLKVLEAIQETFAFLDKKIDVTLANVHFALYSFEFCEDALWGFSYLVESNESSAPIDEKFTSYILQTDDPFTEWKLNAWFFYVDYIGIFEYYQIFSPKLNGEVKYINQIERTDANLQPRNTERELVVAESLYSADDLASSNGFYEGYISRYEYVGNWVEDVQTCFEILGCFPGIGEIASLINGFVYLGRMTKACIEWDETRTAELQKKALENFAGAIPGASIVKGAIKVAKVGKAVNTVIKAEKALEKSKKSVKKSKQALDRISKKKTTKGKKSAAKTNHRKRSSDVKEKSHDLNTAIENRDRLLTEGGLTVGDINRYSKSILSNPTAFYRNTMNMADKVILNKLPTTKTDFFVDAIFELPENIGHIYKALDSFQDGDYETGISEFSKLQRNIIYQQWKLDNPDLKDVIDTSKKLQDTLETHANE